MIVMSFLRYTPILNLYYQLMGAQIGRRVMLGGPGLLDWDLITIGDDSHLDFGVMVYGSDVRGGMLHLGRTHIGSNSNIGMNTIGRTDVTLNIQP